MAVSLGSLLWGHNPAEQLARPHGQPRDPSPEEGPAQGTCLTQVLRATSHSALPAEPTVKGRLLQQSQVIGPQAQAAPPDCATSTRSSSLHPCPPTCPL